MKFPPIPKPLLIVIIVIVILGVVSCGAGVFRGQTEESEPSPDTVRGRLGFEQEPNPVPLDDISLGCSLSDQDGDGSDDDLVIPSTCDVTIERQFLRSRVLSLWVLSIGFPGTISVQQEIDGEYQPKPPKTKGVSNGDVLEISASGVGAVHVRIGCSCTLSLNPT